MAPGPLPCGSTGALGSLFLFRTRVLSHPYLGHLEATVLGWVGVDKGVKERRESDELRALQMIRNVKGCLYKVRHINKKYHLNRI